MTISPGTTPSGSGRELRTMQHRGPRNPERFHWAYTSIRRIETILEAGQSVGAGLAELMRREGCAGGIAQLSGGRLDPFRWVIPADHPTGELPVWYSKTHDIGCAMSIEKASSTLGFDNGEPSTHTHGIWRSEDGRRLGGHLAPDDNLIKDPVSVIAWLSSDAAFTRRHDVETGFDLFAVTGGGQGDGVLATVSPNGDLTQAIEQLAVACGIRQAEIRGTGSVIDLTTIDGKVHESMAFEVGIMAGRIVPQGDGCAVSGLTLAGVGFDGCPVEGVIARGLNNVCVTFELMLAPDGP